MIKEPITKNKTFIDLCMEDAITISKYSDHVKIWENSKSVHCLPIYLGFRIDEWYDYISGNKSISDIINNRKTKK